jgi:hypothetical protein
LKEIADKGEHGLIAIIKNEDAVNGKMGMDLRTLVDRCLVVDETLDIRLIKHIMKQSIFTKEITIEGKNGTMIGRIITTMNSGEKTVSGHNPSSHEDTSRKVPTHKVETFINTLSGRPEPRKIEREILSESEVLRISKEMIDDLTEYLTLKANEDKPGQSFEDKMTELFK